MSTPLNPIDHLVAYTERSHRLLTKNLKAIPEEHRNVSPGGCAHSPFYIVAECSLVNIYMAEALTAGQINRLSPDDRHSHLLSFDTLEKSLAYLDETTARFIETIRGLDDANLGEINNAIGRPITRFALAELPANHMAYHDGQLAYIQTLLGDSVNHWN